MRRSWPPERAALLRGRYATRSNEELGVEFGCSPGTVSCAARRFGLKKSAAYLASIKRGKGSLPAKRAAFIAACSELLERPMGAGKTELIAHAGTTTASARGFLCKALQAGQLFSAGKPAFMRYFLTPQAAEAGAVLIAAEAKARRDAAIKRKRAVASAKYVHRPQRLPKVKAEKPARNPKPPKAPKPPKPLKLTKAKPTRFNPATPKRAAGPAGLDKPADVSRAVKIVAPRTPGRFEVAADYRGPFSLAGIGRDALTGRAWA